MFYYLQISRVLFPEEQKGCHYGARGIGNQMYIDQHILKDCKTRRKNVVMLWINTRKANNMVLQSWITECLKMYNISKKVMQFITKAMSNWGVELTARGKTLADKKIQRGIFQGDALSTLLFIIAMILFNPILVGYAVIETEDLSHNKQTQ